MSLMWFCVTSCTGSCITASRTPRPHALARIRATSPYLVSVKSSIFTRLGSITNILLIALRIFVTWDCHSQSIACWIGYSLSSTDTGSVVCPSASGEVTATGSLLWSRPRGSAWIRTLSLASRKTHISGYVLGPSPNSSGIIHMYIRITSAGWATPVYGEPPTSCPCTPVLLYLPVLTLVALQYELVLSPNVAR